MAVAVITFASLLTPASVSAAITHLYTGGSFGPDGTAATSFADPEAIAVDQRNGDTYVVDTGAGNVRRFDSAHAPLNFSALATNAISPLGSFDSGGSAAQVAVDSSSGAAAGDIYLTDEKLTEEGDTALDVFGPDGSSLGTLAGSSSGEPCGVATDPAGGLYISHFNGLIDKLIPSANPPAEADLASGFLDQVNHCYLAVDSLGDLYAEQWGAGAAGSVERFAPDGADLGTVGQITDAQAIAVDPSDNHLYVDRGSEVVEFDAAGAEVGSFATRGDSRGIAVDASPGPGHGDVYVADAASGQVDVFGPGTVVPTVVSAAASGVTSEAAVLHGSVNPVGTVLGGCFFEWGEAGFEHIAPCEAPAAGEIGAGQEPVEVHAAIAGLTPATTYRYRLLGLNGNGPGIGADRSLTTLHAAIGPTIDQTSAAGVNSGDAEVRALVNPNFYDTRYHFEYVPDATFRRDAETGDGFRDASHTPGADLGSAGTDQRAARHLVGLAPATAYRYRVVAANANGAPVLGPARAFVTAPPAAPFSLPDGRAYELVSPPQKSADLTRQVRSGSVAEAGRSPAGLDPGLYQAAADGGEIAYQSLDALPGAQSHPLVSEYISSRQADGWSNDPITPPQAVPGISFFSDFGVYAAFTADLSVGFLNQLGPALSAEAPAGYDVLYARRTATGGFQPLLSATPPNRPPNSTAAGDFVMAFAGASRDGGHVIFTASDVLAEGAVDPGSGSPAQLYEWSGGEPRLVNVLPGGATATSAGFGDGRTIAGLSGNGNTSSASDLSHAISDDGSRIFWTDLHSGDLYMREDGVRTVQVDAAVGGEGRFYTASADGSTVFFAKGGSLYRYDTDTAQTTDLTPAGGVEGFLGASEDGSYIYYVAAGTAYLWHDGATSAVAALAPGDSRDFAAPGPGEHSARVSPDGRYLAFDSEASPTGYDNTDAVTGLPDVEVYRYDALAGQLACASCEPSGAEPTGSSTVPAWQYPAFEGGAFSASRQPRYLLDDGRLFFNSDDAILPADTNGRQDVYEFEGARPQLISTGRSGSDSTFADASADGDDAFFLTRQPLVGADTDEALDLYDARVGGGIAAQEEPPPLPPCSAEACRAPASPAPPQVSPASAAHPAGEPRHRRHRKKHHARPHMRHRHHRRADADRRGGR